MGFHLLSEIGFDKAIYKEDQFAKVDAYYVPTAYLLSCSQLSRIFKTLAPIFIWPKGETKNFKI